MAQVECPVCSRKFAEDAIESHVIQCLDEQQYKEDEKLARQLERSSDSSSSSSSSDYSGSTSHSYKIPMAIPVARAARARGPAAATGLDVNRPHDGVLGTLKTDPTNTLLAGTDAKEALLELLEERHQLGELELVYQNSVHGNSLATLYSCVGDRSPLIILIEDAHRHLFGCFLTTPLKSQKKLSSFTGTGEAFLFTLRPECEAFRWSGVNGYYVATSSESICIGCGGGGFGLRVGLEGDVTQGASSPCETFFNPTLSGSEFFDCRAVEVWRLA